MNLYFEDQNLENSEEQKELPNDSAKKHENEVKKQHQVIKTKHVYTEKEQSNLLEKASELNKKQYSIY